MLAKKATGRGVTEYREKPSLNHSVASISKMVPCTDVLETA